MKRVIYYLMVVILPAGLVLGCTTAPAPTSEPIVLKAVSKFAQGHGTAWGFERYIDMLNEAAKGELVLEFAGGPETIPSAELPEAVRTGVVDAGFTVAGQTSALVPEAFAHPLSRIAPWEERESGFHDAMVEAFKKANIYYLGRQAGAPFHLFGKVRIENPRVDFKGLSFRGTGQLYKGLYENLGASMVTMSLGEVYTALERGLVVGNAATLATAVRYSWWEVEDYILGPPFYDRGTPIFLINLDTWNRLPKHLQDLMIDTQIKLEREIGDHFTNAYNSEREELLKNGMEFIEWSPADTEWFLDSAYDPGWEFLEEKVGAEVAAKLKGMVQK